MKWQLCSPPLLLRELILPHSGGLTSFYVRWRTFVAAASSDHDLLSDVGYPFLGELTSEI